MAGPQAKLNDNFPILLRCIVQSKAPIVTTTNHCMSAVCQAYSGYTATTLSRILSHDANEGHHHDHDVHDNG